MDTTHQWKRTKSDVSYLHDLLRWPFQREMFLSNREGRITKMKYWEHLGMSQLKCGLSTDGKFKHLRSSQKQHIRNVGTSPAIMYQCFMCYSQKVKIKMILFFRLPSSWTIFASKKQAKDNAIETATILQFLIQQCTFFLFQISTFVKAKKLFLINNLLQECV